MKVLLRKVLCLAALCSFAEESEAQSDSTRRMKDSVRVYDMGEIVVGAEREAQIRTATVQHIPLSVIQRSDVATAEQLAYRIPAGQIRTNSRGEALFFLRGSGERSVGVFLDGALMNIPWDSRVDLAMIPLNAIGDVTIAKGVPSILYGTNVTAGAVNFVTQKQMSDGFTTDVGLSAGQFGYLNGYATHLGATGAFNYIASFGYMQRDAIALPNDAETPFGQIGREERTNTDEKLMSGYIRGEYAFSDLTSVGLSLNFIDGEKGIQSEAHNPARFWRYPEYNNMHAILNLNSHFTEEKDWTLRGTLWFNQFSQTIDQHTDSTYTDHDLTQEDDDATIGGRIVLRKAFGKNSLDLSINGLMTTHDQRDISYDENQQQEDAPTVTYEQNTYSTGLEYNAFLTDDLKLTVGGTYDMMGTPTTGDKPAQGDFSDFSAMVGLGYAINENLVAKANFGRKTRFPTMRELYGEALRRFILNPDLHAERTNILEAGVSGYYSWGHFDVMVFDYITDGTIDRIDTTFILDGEEVSRRKRVNLEGSTTPGFELTAFVTELNPLSIEASIAWMQPRATKDNADGNRYLLERLETVAFLALDYMYEGFQPTIEVSYNKPGYSAVDNVFQELPAYTIINARLAYRFDLGGVSTQVFVRGNNLTDAVPLAQIGLPGAGMEVQGGVKVLF